MNASEFDLATVHSALANTRFAGKLHHFPTIGSTNLHAVEAASFNARLGQQAKKIRPRKFSSGSERHGQAFLDLRDALFAVPILSYRAATERGRPSQPECKLLPGG